MTEEQIVKALECCISDRVSCKKCPLYGDGSPNCWEAIRKNALDLINRQKATIDGLINGQETLQKYIAEKDAEIERLKGESKRFELAFIAECELSACPRKREIRGEAIKEFSKRLKDLTASYWLDNINKGHIDKVVKEMVGEADA